MPAHDTRWPRKDVVAGLSTAAVLILPAMTYAFIAGLPIQVFSTPWQS